MYNSARAYIGDGTIDLNSHTFKVMLTSNSYTPSAAHTQKSNVTNEVANGNGYTSGGETLTSVTFNYSGTTATWDADDVSWTGSVGSIGPFRIAVIYDDTASNDELVCYCILDSADITVTAGSTFTIQFNASGILSLTGATS